MRLDLFLKMSRLIKRRSLAKEICDAGCVRINGRIAKAGAEVKVADVLTVDIRDRLIRARILHLPLRVEGPEGVVEMLTEESE
ncbi:S4 domain-containing protein [Acidithiobacillus sp. M4-SHS-6]|uniref:S4 domain-containing protein n=1 Tax=Acidithiobacillus sp. M4-SHS-6 TaxID=3383024 RepID=UPI0039BE95B6